MPPPSFLKERSHKWIPLIEQALIESIENMGPKTDLRDACEYALQGGGKRLRPMLVLLIAETLSCAKPALPAALSVEFFHTASLIADDLPCMDNDSLRRNRPALHRVFGEASAILASYSLIAAGYEGIYRAALLLPQKRVQEAVMRSLEAASRLAGNQGASYGQFLDLYPPCLDWNTLEKIIVKKTATLFELCFTLGWLFGLGDVEQLPEVENCARHLGIAFQIADDLQDDLLKSSSLNAAKILGREKAFGLFEAEIARFEEGLGSLGLWNESFQELIEALKAPLYR